MQEFQLIQQIQQQTNSVLPVASQGVAVGIGDDGAVLEVPAGKQLVISTDTLSSGIHFPVATLPYDIGYKSLAVNLSDLAAMGAVPRWALLALVLPRSEPQWLQSFTAGFLSLAQDHNVILVGGDTSAGSVSITVTVMGLVEPGHSLLRSGAQPGDLIVVSGTVGGAARVLELMQTGQFVSEQHLLDHPHPRVALGQALTGYASACIDISDGLIADLGHLIEASGCGARVNIEKLPAAGVLAGLEDEQKWNYQLAGGDDYELLFTLPPGHKTLLTRWSRDLALDLSVIGTVMEGEGAYCQAPDGSEFQPRGAGFEHFGQRACDP